MNTSTNHAPKGKSVAIKVRVVRGRFNTPLMLLDGGPFSGVELTPHQVRYLAAALVGTADAAMKEDVAASGWRPRTIVLGDALGSKAPAAYGGAA